MPLEPQFSELVDAHVGSPPALAVIGFGICWPNDSPFVDAASIELMSGESVDEAAARLDLSWTPRWLIDAGFELRDAAGQRLFDEECASATGDAEWRPPLRTCRVDDQVSNRVRVGSQPYRRRLAGEIALLACWWNSVREHGLNDMRPIGDLDGNTRGSLFRHFLVYLLQRALPADWTVDPEVPLTSIRGLHMRTGIGRRSSDIVVIDDGGRLVAVISSKWTWRSDRGTEAAQILPLRRFRPDVPYGLVTAEFARAQVVARESVEDRTYHLCPEWVGAWLAVQQEENPRTAFPSLRELRTEGRRVATNLDLAGLDSLISDLTDSGTIL